MTNQHFCPVCKHEIEPSAVCCKYCGTPFIAHTLGQATPSDKEGIPKEHSFAVGAENSPAEFPVPQEPEPVVDPLPLEMLQKEESEDAPEPFADSFEPGPVVPPPDLSDTEPPDVEPPVNSVPGEDANKTVNILRKILAVLFGVLFVAVLLPFTHLTGMFFVNVGIAFFCAVGFLFMLLEKQHIHKFIYGAIFGFVGLTAYIALYWPFPPTGVAEPLYLALFGGIFLLSVIGNIADRHTGYEKANIWFNGFSYILFFANVCFILLLAVAWLIAPGLIMDGLKTYVIVSLCVCALNALAAFLMIRRVSFGADLFMIAAIAFIVLNVVAYHQLMEAVGYRDVFNGQMHVIGGYFSKFIAGSVIYPIVMFFWLRILKSRAVEQTR